MTAYASPAHDVLQKIAAESLVPVPEGGPCSLNLPKSWLIHRDSNSRISFTVPYHPGVMGVIEKTEKTLAVDDALAHVAEAFKSELSILKQLDFHENGLSGVRIEASGRLGGEIWYFFIYAGRITSDTEGIFYAAAPESWFAAYSLLFDDILHSFH